MKREKLSGKVDWPGRHKSDPKPILYFSGVQGRTEIPHKGQLSGDQVLFNATKWQYRCMSFYYWERENRVKAALDYSLSVGVKIFMDSGAFTLQQDANCNWEKVREYAERYGRFLDSYRGKVHWYAGLDWRRNTDITWNAQALMEKLGYYPVPVYHGNDSIVEFQRLLDAGYPFIAIAKAGQAWSSFSVRRGSDLRRYYDTVFHYADKYKCALHGLAQTGEMMFAYPWYSVDSTSWISGAQTGTLFLIDGKHGRINAVDIGPQKVVDQKKAGGRPYRSVIWEALDEATRKFILAEAKRFGLTLQGLLTNYEARMIYNVNTLQEAIEKGLYSKQTPRYTKVLL